MWLNFFITVVCFCSFNLHAKIYDCFLFLNELELLEIRLHEMDPYVDKFVIVESCETFRGGAKPFNFAENIGKFSEFLHKIIYIQLNERQDTSNPWVREFFQRNQIMRGLERCDDNDIVLISDVDEIVRGREIVQIVEALKKQKFVGVSHEYHANFLNDVCGSYWRGTVAVRYNMLHTSNPQTLRGMKDDVPSVATGWHYTWMGDADRILYKLGAFSHAEADTPEYRKGLVEGWDTRYLNPTIEIDETFPDYVRENQEYFFRLGFLRPPRL